MATFEIYRAQGWYEAECRELGLKITARRLEEVETTARHAAARARGANGRVSFVLVKRHESLLQRLAGLFALLVREHRPKVAMKRRDASWRGDEPTFAPGDCARDEELEGESPTVGRQPRA